MTDSGKLTKLQVREIWCSSKSACIQPPNEVQLQLVTLGKLEVGENQFVWFLTWAIVQGKCLFWLCVYRCGFFRTISQIFFLSSFIVVFLEEHKLGASVTTSHVIN